MKKIWIVLAVIIAIASCKKEDEFRPSEFPGFTGAGEQATWVVSRHNVLDQSFLGAVLAAQSPPSTLNAFDSTIKAGYAKETSPFSIRLYKDGSIATVAGSNNQFSWIKQSNLKWENSNDEILISDNQSGTWIPVATALADQDKLLVKYRRSYFEYNSTEKDKPVLDIYYSIFN